MASVNFRKNINVLVHILAWMILGFSLFYYPTLDWPVEPPTEFWLKQFFLFSLLVCLYYLNTSVLIPRFMFKDKQVWYVVVLAILCAVQISISRAVDRSVDDDQFRFAGRSGQDHRGRRAHYDNIFPMIDSLLIGIGIIICFSRKWQQEVTARQTLEQEKTKSELLYLKAQINPHFFFNTLNTIYAFTLTDGDVARRTITDLSQMMRYVLYESQNGKTFLSEEIAFTRKYIELMKLRLTDKMTISMVFPDKPAPLTIAPMLFLPFIENAFKHGTSAIEMGQIAISLIQSESALELKVINTIFKQKRETVQSSNGIGLVNTRRRLDLLYPGKYELTTGSNENSEFEVNLKLITA